MLRDIRKGEDDQIAAIAQVIAHTDPDILVLTDFDYDLEGQALTAFNASLSSGYPHVFALRPNTGIATGRDMDQNGRLGEARDAQGYGRFAGDGGMAILSRLPIMAEDVQEFSSLLWKDLPGAILPELDGAPFLPDQITAVQRLSSSGHWSVPIQMEDGEVFHLLTFAATPPVFDGPEDRNGLRNRDELRLWEAFLDGSFGPVPASFVIAGNANLDPENGAGLTGAMAGFLARPDVQDPLPGLPTADWDDDGPGDLRVSYVLPSVDWQISAAGVFWPAADDPAAALLGDDGLAAGVHHLVWVDVRR
ncbi:endonuclease/exonuclease/phosphatase family protein [Yoonia sp. BS5-3]|uniref:Endonuclease/exonuclease/phosphatase family protein n=1 Tax=Yoonia phaeophyticola TaxID=3137369 RepID=A0ABZ2V9W2_9RHOB